MPPRVNAAEISKIQNMIKDIETDLTILKSKDPEVPPDFLQRMATLEMRYKTIEKTLKPAKR